MGMFHHLVLLCCLSAVWSVPDIGPMTTVARCRVRCLEKLAQLKTRTSRGETDCQKESSCSSCWDFCLYLMVSTEMYSFICKEKQQCVGSCKVVCDFKENMHNKSKSTESWKFPNKPAVFVYPSTQTIEIGWPQPESMSHVPIPTSFVYVLLAREKSTSSLFQDWFEILQTSNTDVLLNQGKLSRVHEFWLLAISRDSAVADVKFNMTSLPFSDVVDIKKDEYKLRNWPIHVEVSIVRDIQNGTIMALAEWDHPNKVAMPQSDAYSIHLFLEDCEAYDDSPPCDVPPQLFTDTLFHSKEKRLSFSIPNLMFNALYRVRVELDSDWYGEAEFYTDFCVNVDWRTYTTCSDVAPYDRVASPRPHPNQKTPLPYNPLLYTVNMLSCHYDANSNRVVVSFNWTVPFNKSYVDVYLVKALDLNMSAAFDTTVDRTNSPNYTFTLYPYREYVISVEAKYRTDNGSRLSRNSELLLFNTSWITNMPVKSSLDDKGGDLKSSFLIKAATTTTTPPLPQRSDISCNADSIDTFVPISMLPSGAPLTWRDPTCSITSNGTHMISSIGLSQCGTTVTITKDNVEFENELKAQSTNSTANSLIDFGEDAYVIPVKCIYPRTETPMTSYVPLQQHVRFYEKRYGHFDVDIMQYDSDKFSSAIQNLGTPRKVALNSEIYVEVKLNDQFNNGLGIHIDKCIATPTSSPSDSTLYTLLTDGCPASQHVHLYNSPANKVRFGIRAFQFTSQTGAMVYIHCQTSMCQAGTPYCTSNCVTAGRRKRDVAPDQKSHLVSAGPFVLVADEQGTPIRMSTIVASVSAFVAVVACVVAIVGWTRKTRTTSTKEQGLL